MKKYVVILAAACLAVACTSKETPEVLSSKVFNASIEPETKTYTEAKKVYWYAGDAVSIFDKGNTENDNVKYTYAGEDGTTRGPLTTQNLVVASNSLQYTYGIYPYYSDNLVLSEGKAVAYIDPKQDYEVDSFGDGANAMVAVSADNRTLEFKNVAGYLKLRLYGDNSTPIQAIQVANVADSIELRTLFGNGFPEMMKEMLISILPITVFFFVLNYILMKLEFQQLSRIGLGIFYTYIGLTVFMTGANYGFMPAGVYLGQMLGKLPYSWLIVPVGMLIGYLVVRAEPAVYVLMRQVEDLTDGAITGTSLQLSMCVGVGVSVGLSMLRVILGINVLWFIIPGYALALAMSFLCPKLFTAIAFDSGGVASGPMTAAFLLPMTMGFCTAMGGNIATDAFGVVALVAMTPLITIQALGLIYRFRTRHHVSTVPIADPYAELPDDAVIEL